MFQNGNSEVEGVWRMRGGDGRGLHSHGSLAPLCACLWVEAVGGSRSSFRTPSLVLPGDQGFSCSRRSRWLHRHCCFLPSSLSQSTLVISSGLGSLDRWTGRQPAGLPFFFCLLSLLSLLSCLLPSSPFPPSPSSSPPLPPCLSFLLPFPPLCLPLSSPPSLTTPPSPAPFMN